MDQGNTKPERWGARARRAGRPEGMRPWWRQWIRLWPGVALPLGIILGRAQLLGYAGPFGFAWVAALRGQGSPAAWLAAAGVALGLITSMGGGGQAPMSLGWMLTLLRGILALALLLALTRPRGGTRPGSAGSALAVGVAAAAYGLMEAAPAGGLVYWLGPGMLSLSAGLLCLILSRGFRQARAAAAPVWEGDGALAGLLLAVGVVGGLQGIGWGPVALPTVLAGAAVMAAGWAAGPLAGASAGLLAGLAGLVAGPLGVAAVESHAVAAVTYGAAGLLCGAFRDLGRWGVALAYILAYWVLSFLPATGTPEQVQEAVLGALLPALAFAALPRRWMESGRQWLAAGLPSPAAAAAEAAAEPAVEAAAGPRLLAMARVLRDVQRTVNRAAPLPPPVPPPAPDALAPLVGEVQERVCHGCSLYKRCWEQEFFRTYQIFSDLWGRLEEDGPLPPPLVPDALQRHCSYPMEVVSAFNTIWDLRESEQRCTYQLREARQQLGEQLQTVARMLEHLAEEASAARTGAGAAAEPRYRLRVGVARMAKQGTIICGDSYVAEPLGPDRHLLALSDGTGAGKDAAAESQQAVRLVQGLLRAGYRLESAVQTVNSALLLRETGDRFPTLDVMVVDLVSGRADLVKVGAAPTAFKRGPHVQIVQGEAPPAGVLYPLPIEPEFRVLRSGDWVVMASDGLWERGRADGGRWLQEYLSSAEAALPEFLAESILARAVESEADEPSDDITVLVARVEPMSETPPGTEGRAVHPPAGEPVPARRAAQVQVQVQRQAGRRGARR